MSVTKDPCGKIDKEKEAEKWDNRELGASLEHAQRAPAEMATDLDTALGLKNISIRLQKELIQELKRIGKEEGLGYQPLIRQVLTQYVKHRKATSTQP